MFKDTYVVIPAYKAEKTIAQVIESIKKEHFSNIVVVDDGNATNKVAEISRKHGAIVLQHAINRGYGAALRTGYEYALKAKADYIISFDADGQHHANEIINLLEPLQENKADVTLGSRFLKKKTNAPFWRRIFLKGGTVINYIFYGLYLTDSHNGFRGMTSKALKKMNFELDRMEHASEYPAEIKRNKLRYIEVPVTITYSEQTLSDGQSTLNAFKILFKMIIHKLGR